LHDGRQDQAKRAVDMTCFKDEMTAGEPAAHFLESLTLSGASSDCMPQTNVRCNNLKGFLSVFYEEIMSFHVFACWGFNLGDQFVLGWTVGVGVAVFEE